MGGRGMFINREEIKYFVNERNNYRPNVGDVYVIKKKDGGFIYWLCDNVHVGCNYISYDGYTGQTAKKIIYNEKHQMIIPADELTHYDMSLVYKFSFSQLRWWLEHKEKCDYTNNQKSYTDKDYFRVGGIYETKDKQIFVCTLCFKFHVHEMIALKGYLIDKSGYGSLENYRISNDKFADFTLINQLTVSDWFKFKTYAANYICPNMRFVRIKYAHNAKIACKYDPEKNYPFTKE